jgi:hypothetical protein
VCGHFHGPTCGVHGALWAIFIEKSVCVRVCVDVCVCVSFCGPHIYTHTNTHTCGQHPSILRVGQNRISAPYICTACMVILLLISVICDLRFSSVVCSFQCGVLFVRLARTISYTLYMTKYLVVSLPKKSYIHRICTVLANPTHNT